MALTEVRRPYEFLVRWNKDGVMSGAHVAFRNVILRDGVVINDQNEPPMPVTVGGMNGFPLADLLNETQSAAITRAEVAEVERDAALAEAEATAKQLAEATTALAERDESLASLQRQLADATALAGTEAAKVADLRQAVAVKDGQIAILTREA